MYRDTDGKVSRYVSINIILILLAILILYPYRPYGFSSSFLSPRSIVKEICILCMYTRYVYSVCILGMMYHHKVTR